VSLLEYLRATGSKKFRVVGQYADGGGIGEPAPKTRSPLAPKDWVRDWYANRQMINPTHNLMLDKIRPDLLNSIDTLPDTQYLDILSNKDALGQYIPANHKIEMSNKVKDSDYGKSILVHEMGHSVDVPNANKLSDINKYAIKDNTTSPLEGFRNVYGGALDDLRADYEERLNIFRQENSLGKEPLTNKDLSKVDSDSLLNFLNEDNNLFGDNIFNINDTDKRDIALNRLNGKVTIQDENLIPKDIYGRHEYLSEPTEVSSRIMQLRYDMGVKPDEVVTPIMLRDFMEKNNQLEYLQDLRNISKDGTNSIIQMLNKMVSNDTPKKNSGYLDYLKSTKNT
jgi:hypothetical protein